MTDVPEPDLTRRLPTVDAEDPLLEAFAYQHDLRERFRAALMEASELFDQFEGDETTDRWAIVGKVCQIVKDAIDPEKIYEWIEAGRPLPSLEGEVDEQGNAIDHLVAELYEPTLSELREDPEEGGSIEVDDAYPRSGQ